MQKQTIEPNEMCATYVFGDGHSGLLWGDNDAGDAAFVNGYALTPEIIEAIFKAHGITHVVVFGQDGLFGDCMGGVQTVAKFLEWYRNI